MSHESQSYEDDIREELRREDRAARARPTHCLCFSPGECSGTCPGPENCPYQGDDE